jgi:hypothetical protein
MSNEKLIIQKLVALATKQQKILEKLAQTTPPPDAQNNPQHLGGMARPNLRPAETFLNALPPNVRKNVVNIEESGNEMHVKFAPGQDTDANWNVVFNTLKTLVNPPPAKPGTPPPLRLDKAYTLKSV